MIKPKEFRVLSHDDIELEDELRNESFRKASIQFIKNARANIGAVKTKAMVEALSETLGHAWSSQVVFDMLTDEHAHEVEIRFTTYSSQGFIVPQIKAVREATGCSLNEARDLLLGLYKRVTEVTDRHREAGTELPRAMFMPYAEIKVKVEDRTKTIRQLHNARLYTI